MENYIGIDVSLELSSVCVVDASGAILCEAKVQSEPEVIVAFIRDLQLPITRVGLEAGPLSQWLHDGICEGGYDTALLETRHVKAVLSAMVVKTDRRDARGIAQLLRMGWYRPVHRKSASSQEMRALLAGRRQMQAKAIDLEQTLRGLLRGFGMKVGPVSRGKLAARIRELVAGQEMQTRIIEPMLSAREAIWREFAKLHREVLAIVKADETCRRLMTTPGVGAVVSLTFRAGVDDPNRFTKSKAVGAFFGLTPKRYQSGETDIVGGISRVGDASVRSALLTCSCRESRASAPSSTGLCRLRNAGGCGGQRSHWRASWRQYSIGFGSMGRNSSGASNLRPRLSSSRNKKFGRRRPSLHEVPSPGRGDGETGSVAVAGKTPVSR